MTPCSLAAASDVGVLLAGDSTATEADGHLVVASPAEPEFWWGNFVLLPAVPADGTASVETFRAALPHAEHRSIGFDDPSACAADAAWYTSAGFVVEEMVVLVADAARIAASPRRPSGLECRPLDAASDRDWEAHAALGMRCGGAASGITASFLAGRAATRRRIAASGSGQWWGAWSPDGELVGQLGVVAVGGGRVRYQSVETDPAWQRRGIAGELLVLAAAGAVADLRADEAVIVADPGYWAIELYRSVGFADAERQVQATLPPSRHQ